MDNLPQEVCRPEPETQVKSITFAGVLYLKKPPTSSGYILDYTLVLSDLAHPPLFHPELPQLSFCLSDTLILNTHLASHHYLNLASVLSLATAGSYIKIKKAPGENMT